MMFIVRYGEIGLKGKNRRSFERQLEKNILKKLKVEGFAGTVTTKRGRILVDTEKGALDIFSRIPGIVSYAYAEKMEYEDVFSYLKEVLASYSPASFKVAAHRVDKSFPKTSPEINREIGDFIVENFGWRVNLSAPELVVGVEIIDSNAYVFLSNYRGVGGLPVGSAGKLLLLLSPGLDSPVAGYMMLRRGASIVALHFSQGPVGEEKVRRYVERLSDYTPEPIELKVIPHSTVLKRHEQKLRAVHRPEWTCVMCKYLMLHEAENVAREVGALGIVTGDSLGQVASQTLQNMLLEEDGLSVPVYRPLIGMDKVEIESIARKIGTMPIYLSMKEETCPYRPRHVITGASKRRFSEVLELISDP